MTLVVPVSGRSQGAPLGSSPVVAHDQTLREAVRRIEQGSASWRAAVDALATTGRRAVVLTPEQVRMRDGETGLLTDFDRSSIAEALPVADERGNVATVVVVVNLAQIRAAHDRLGSLPGEFHADLERVLAHEVYGHAVPYLLAGHLSGRCPDPAPGAVAKRACAIQRENEVRSELRLGRRTDRDLASLALARLSRD